jgi:hypothetical protein
MIPAVIAPQITELQNTDARLLMSDKAIKRENDELTAKGNQPNADDSASLVAMVLADPDNIVVADDAAKIKANWAKRAAIDTARQSIKAKLAVAKHEAGTAILKSAEVQKTHGEIMQRLTTGLVEVSKAWVDLFGMSRELRDREIGFRCGICELMPVDLFGPPTPYSPLATLLHEAVKLGYLKAGQVPKEFRA